MKGNICGLEDKSEERQRKEEGRKCSKKTETRWEISQKQMKGNLCGIEKNKELYQRREREIERQIERENQEEFRPMKMGMGYKTLTTMTEEKKELQLEEKQK